MFEIRRAGHDDARGIISAHVRSIREVCAKDYSAEQIAAWSGREFSEAIWRSTMDRDLVWVVAAQGRVSGFGHARLGSDRKATIEGLYLAPEAVGHGLGRDLMSLIFSEFTEHGVEEAHLTSTRTAEGFYCAMGFSVLHPTVVKFGGVPVECIEMRMGAPFRIRGERFESGH